MPIPQTLEGAIQDVQRGHAERFSEVVEAYHVQIRTFINAITHDPFDSDDLAQQTFLFAYQHINEYQIGTNFMAWLKAIAYNHIRDYRAHSQRSSSVERRLREQISRTAIESLGPTELDPRLELLNDCIERLPSNQRSFLKTVCGRRSTLEDVALELNRPGTWVRKTLSRLYEILRNCVERRLENSEASA